MTSVGFEPNISAGSSLGHAIGVWKALVLKQSIFHVIQALDKMEQEWKAVILEILPYKETGTFIMKIGEDVSQLLDDHIVMTQSMSFSPYKKVFEDRIASWDSKLQMTQDVIDEWLTCQRSWLYLEPIFRSVC